MQHIAWYGWVRLRPPPAPTTMSAHTVAILVCMRHAFARWTSISTAPCNPSLLLFKHFKHSSSFLIIHRFLLIFELYFFTLMSTGGSQPPSSQHALPSLHPLLHPKPPSPIGGCLASHRHLPNALFSDPSPALVAAALPVLHAPRLRLCIDSLLQLTGLVVEIEWHAIRALLPASPSAGRSDDAANPHPALAGCRHPTCNRSPSTSRRALCSVAC